ncbi:2Fe-2S iron-sulfur cluster-binding protein [Bradyrhizobium erythrophlei]
MLHSLQLAFIEHDGFQCGLCTAGQIMCGVAMIEEARAGWPSAATADRWRKDLNNTYAELLARNGALMPCSRRWL